MKIKFIILGCGSSLGVPRADGSWGNCDPKEKKNYRTRCSAFIKSNIKNILIDTSPDLRHQLIKNKINNIDYVIYSHKHGDQVHGINDLRVFSLKNKKKISVYADYQTGKYIKNNFSYCFKSTPSYKAILKLFNLKKRFEDIFSIFKVTDINDFENFIINLKKKANLESDFAKLKIDLSNDFDRIMRGVNLLRLRNNPINLKKSDIKTILLKK